MTRPSSTAETIVAKSSSARTMSAASFETSVPVIPMATPMSARLRAGRVVHAVTSHGDRLAEPLQRLHDAQLVPWLDPREHGDLANARVELLVLHRVEVGAGHDELPSEASSGRMPTSRAIAAPVAAWSPVIILTVMPARCAAATAAVASGRGGSMRPQNPTKTQPLSASLLSACPRRQASPCMPPATTLSACSANASWGLRISLAPLGCELRPPRPRRVPGRRSRAPSRRHPSRAGGRRRGCGPASPCT